jgi:hypothetical protein
MRSFIAERSIFHRTAIAFAGVLLALGFAGGLNTARAVSVAPGQVLPSAISYEYFGLNYAPNIQTSNTVGTLDYTGGPGCGGTCLATTTLGSNPSVFATVNEVVFAAGSGGGVKAQLGYYVAYLNAPGTYNVHVHATDNISVPAGDLTAVSAFLGFGKAGTNFANFNNFDGPRALEEADCVTFCPAPGFLPSVPMGPFVADHLVSMEANTLYFMELDLLFNAQPTNNDVSALIDPAFFDDFGGTFVFSPGVFGPVATVTPIPGALPLFAAGLSGLGILGWRRRRTPAPALRV